MAEEKRYIKVLDLGDSWKQAIQSRMGSDEVREQMEKEAEERRKKAMEKQNKAMKKSLEEEVGIDEAISLLEENK